MGSLVDMSYHVRLTSIRLLYLFTFLADTISQWLGRVGARHQPQ